MKKLLNLFTPFKRVDATTRYGLYFAQAFLIIGCLQMFSNELIPKPFEILQTLFGILQTRNFYDDLFASLTLTFKAMSLAILIALPISYLVKIAFFEGITLFITKLRFLTLTGLGFVFLVLLNGDSASFRISLLLFGIIPFFVTSLLSEYAKITTDELNLCKTLKMSPWQSLYELVIYGKLDSAILAVGVNFAICWIMITYVEGQTMGYGGLGTIMIKQQKYLHLTEVFSILTIIFTIGNLSDFLTTKFREIAFPHTSIQSIK